MAALNEEVTALRREVSVYRNFSKAAVTNSRIRQREETGERGGALRLKYEPI